MGHLLYLMFRCNGKFGKFVGSEHSLKEVSVHISFFFFAPINEVLRYNNLAVIQSPDWNHSSSIDVTRGSAFWMAIGVGGLGC